MKKSIIVLSIVVCFVAIIFLTRYSDKQNIQMSGDSEDFVSGTMTQSTCSGISLSPFEYIKIKHFTAYTSTSPNELFAYKLCFGKKTTQTLNIK